MGKETTIKLSREFKDILQKRKQGGDDFEETIKRIIKENSILKTKGKKQYTPLSIPEKPYKKTIKEPKKEFIEEDIPKPKQEKVFKNMSDFNLEVHRIKLLELEEPKKEFIMGIEVSDPMGKDGKRIVMRKYKETSHLGTVSEIKSNFQITEIPYDPSQHLNHMKNYAL